MSFFLEISILNKLIHQKVWERSRSYPDEVILMKIHPKDSMKLEDSANKLKFNPYKLAIQIATVNAINSRIEILKLNVFLLHIVLTLQNFR